MKFLYVSLLLFSSNILATPIEELILKNLSIALPDNNTRSVSNSLDLCSVSVAHSSFDHGLTLSIKKSYQGRNCHASYNAGFGFNDESNCKLERDGNRQEITCAWSDCETQGCSEVTSQLTIEGNVFKIGDVKCDLGRKSRSGQDDISCHP